MAFLRIEIQLNEALCKCPDQKWEWKVEKDGSKNNLIIRCSSCLAREKILHDQFLGRFKVTNEEKKVPEALSNWIDLVIEVGENTFM